MEEMVIFTITVTNKHFRLIYQDEAGFGRINKPKACWCGNGIRPVVPYTPELNSIEMIWDELREKFFKNDFFRTLSAVVDRHFEGLNFLELNHNVVKSITGWDWIVSMVAKEN